MLIFILTYYYFTHMLIGNNNVDSQMDIRLILNDGAVERVSSVV